MHRDSKSGESKCEWLKKVRKAPCSKLTREWFGCDDDMVKKPNNDEEDKEIKIGDFVINIDPKGDEFLAESLKHNGVKFHSSGHTFWLGESSYGMSFAKELTISSSVACSVINDVQQP